VKRRGVIRIDDAVLCEEDDLAETWRRAKHIGATHHRVRRTVERRAYGYKSFRNYRLRLLNACA
jgi:hypothetical protein